MRTKGLLCTPISRFGIGVLSAFMIADRVSVRTHPGGTENDERRAIDLRDLSGPGSLFWTKPGTLTKQGTEVTLWLRHELHGKPLDIHHEWETCRSELRRHFALGGRREVAKDLGRDPVLAVGLHIVWPRYPIRVRPPDGREWTLDDRFYLEHLMPLNVGVLTSQANAWGIADDFIGEPRWGFFDWIDQAGSEATGTRIRLLFPRHFFPPTSNEFPLDPPVGSPLMPLWALSALTELQLGWQRERSMTFVQGIYVADYHVRLDQGSFGLGCGIWVDFRGAAAPQLTVNRARALETGPAWDNLVQGIWDRWLHDLVSEAAAVRNGLPNLLLFLPGEHKRIACCGRPAEGLGSLIPYGFGLDRTSITLLVSRFLMDRGMDRAEVDGFAVKLATANRSFASGFSLNDRIGTVFDRNVRLERALVRVYKAAAWLTGSRTPDDGSRPLDPHLLIQVQGEALQEAFSTDLERSWPLLNLFSASGRVGDGVLTSPAQFRMDLDGRRVRFADPLGQEPKELVSLGYDLCFPMTSIPLGRLRAEFSLWRENPGSRRQGVRPFLHPYARQEWASSESFLKLQFRGLNRLYAFSPALELWLKPFAEWTKSDWTHRDNRSYLWNIGTGEILVASGAMTIRTMKKRGQPYMNFVASIET